MTIKDFARILNGREYGSEIDKKEEEIAKLLGFVVVFGYSDDNTEFRGAINAEQDSWQGATFNVYPDGLIKECFDNCDAYQKAKEKCKTLKAVWCGKDDYSWSYETDIPHATFDIVKDGENYCEGIVFDLNNLG